MAAGAPGAVRGGGRALLRAPPHFNRRFTKRGSTPAERRRRYSTFIINLKPIETCAFTAKAGHLEVLQWARKRGCSWSEIDVP